MNSGLVFMKLVEGKMSFNLQLENLVVGPTTMWVYLKVQVCVSMASSCFLSRLTIIQCAYQLSMIRQDCTRLPQSGLCCTLYVLAICTSAFLFPVWFLSGLAGAHYTTRDKLVWSDQTVQDSPNTYLCLHIALSGLTIIQGQRVHLSWVWLDKTACLSIRLDI